MSSRSNISRIRRRRRRAKRNKRNILLLTIVMCIVSATILFSGFELKKKMMVYAAQEQEIQLKLDAEQERTKEIEKLREYTQSDEYVEEVAREKLGLVYPNEIIFRQSE